VGASVVQEVPPGHARTAPRIPWTPRTFGERALMARLVTDDDPMTEPFDAAWGNNTALRNVSVEAYLPAAVIERVHRLRLGDTLDRTQRALELMTERFPPEVDLTVEWIDPLTGEPIEEPPAPAARMLQCRRTPVADLVPPAVLKETYRSLADGALRELDRELAAFSEEGMDEKAGTQKQDEAGEESGTEAFRVLSWPLARLPGLKEILVKISFKIPESAKPGDVFTLHVRERGNPKAAGGMTYVTRVAK